MNLLPSPPKKEKEKGKGTTCQRFVPKTNLWHKKEETNVGKVRGGGLLDMGMGIHAYGEFIRAWMAYDHGHMGLGHPGISTCMHGGNMQGYHGSKLVFYIYGTHQELSYDHICNLYASKIEMHYNILKTIDERQASWIWSFFWCFLSTKYVRNDDLLRNCVFLSLNGCFKRQFSISVSCFPWS